MRILLVTFQQTEAEFCRHVSRELSRLGHQVSHVVISRLAASRYRQDGLPVYCAPKVMAQLGEIDYPAEVARIEASYQTPSLRDVYRIDVACRGRTERWCVERTTRYFLALERIFDEVSPEIVVPEVGRETLLHASHLIGLQRGAAVLWQLHSIFPRSLRLYVNSYHAPIVTPEEVRPLEDDERAEVEEFIASFTRRATPVLPYRRTTITPRKIRDTVRNLVVRAFVEHDNEYLRPVKWLRNWPSVKLRRAVSRGMYEDPSRLVRPFVYFPIHDTDDFKIERAIPHCADQEHLIREVANALPQGYDVVLKEHPFSIGRNSVAMLRRLCALENVRLVDPLKSSHDLMQRAAAITVISSTVGIEALLYGRPVLTMGQPYYAGYGVTLDVDSFREIREAVPAVLRFSPDRERILEFIHAGMRSTYDSKPCWVDRSEENAVRLARSLDEAARKQAPQPASAAPVPSLT